MEMSVREAKAQFSAALAAAERGEAVVVTRHGKPVATIVPYVPPRKGLDWDRLRAVRAELGLDKVKDAWPEGFDDPAFSRAVLGLDD